MNPITRKEMFLAAAGGQDVETPTPITREEVFLNEIAKGGGGSSLPSTETASAGDVLSLDDNKEPQWAAPSGSGGGVLVVNVTETESETNYIYTCDKTAGEIQSALEEKAVIFKYETGDFELCVGGGPYLNGYKFVRGGTSSGDVQFTALSLTDYPHYED